jgi:succinyl-CoA:acetate CoA-transferase
MSGFTGSGYPKAVPLALARRIEGVHAPSIMKSLNRF